MTIRILLNRSHLLIREQANSGFKYEITVAFDSISLEALFTFAFSIERSIYTSSIRMTAFKLTWSLNMFNLFYFY